MGFFLGGIESGFCASNFCGWRDLGVPLFKSHHQSIYGTVTVKLNSQTFTLHQSLAQNTRLLARMSKKSQEAGAKPTRIKIVSFGPPASGKSCLVKRFCENRFVGKYIATIGVDYGVKPHTVDGKSVRVNFWDLSGHGEFLEVRNEFYKDTQGLVMVFDVSSRESFASIEAFAAEAKTFGVAKGTPGVLCANKVDLPRRLVTEAEGRAAAASLGYIYFETSASTGANVSEVFEHIFAEAIRR